MARVLLADDEEALRLMMGRQLRRAGHEVTLAEDGLVAVDILQTASFDVVISDMKMPRLDGMGLLAHARKLAPDTEFIILTGHGSMENAVEAFKTGNVFDYLLKPLDDIRELDAVVERAVERRHLRRENMRLVCELEERIQQLESTKRELTELAARDGLTGLWNHRTVNSRLEKLLEAHRDDEQACQICVVLLDMDGFKTFNDTYGHLVGDQVLRHIAGALLDGCASLSDERRLLADAGRCGGDEFMVIIEGGTAEDARAFAECVRVNLSERPFVNPEGTALPIQLCYGIADSISAGSSPIALLAAADAALYASKQSGGGTVTLHLTTNEDDEEPYRSTFDVLDGLVTAIDHKDRYTKRHSEDVTRYALLLAEKLRLSDETMNAVRLAGLLHDVGKIGVPDSILRKPGKLTPEEYEIMKNHVTLSALIIHGLPRLSDILDAVANHHERWDGRGYPKGLAGETIPLLGRLMAIADAFSAMTLDRPYRAGLSIEAALAEIERGAGTQFDPTLAPIFMDAIRGWQESLAGRLQLAA
jgi:diguanylate cyclase (GGDEF)-like protein/putative nucleotidyltransferase with HDIG domain